MASAEFQLAVFRTDGQLPTILRGYQEEGLSVRGMSRRLLTEYNVEISNVALGRWLEWAQELGA